MKLRYLTVNLSLTVKPKVLVLYFFTVKFWQPQLPIFLPYFLSLVVSGYGLREADWTAGLFRGRLWALSSLVQARITE